MVVDHLNVTISTTRMTHLWWHCQQGGYITIYGNGRSVQAKVVDECGFTMGYDADLDYQPPCPNNIVDASKAVWKALGVPESDRGDLDISWSDA
uniref:Uncharacterized protein n=1 Tax=Quercus lobata TaxID=97700 RepID=A0A7N2R9H1_QUELO